MSSLKEKKKRVLATRRRTKKRLKLNEAGPEESFGLEKSVSLKSSEALFKNQNDDGEDEETTGEIKQESTSPSGQKDLWTSEEADKYISEAVRKLIGCDKKIDNDNDNVTIYYEDGCETRMPLVSQVTRTSSNIEKCMKNASKFIKNLRSSETKRQKKLCVVIVPSKKQFVSMMSTINAGVKQTKKRSKFGCSSGKNASYSYAGFGFLEGEKEKDSREINSQILKDFKGGKVHTVFVTDSEMLWLKPFASKVSVIIQVSKYPRLETYARRISSLVTTVSVSCLGKNTGIPEIIVRNFFFSASK
mmetsp:Transcript_17046/g.19297  ORF Transcript_17046/g.19297 Transcript_17046/m.19297 type:complete len:303 (+) Transcript_17046:14-922(+)